MAQIGLERLTGLIAFARAGSLGSYTAAARALAVSPSAVSKSIQRLEQQLGVALFTRTTRSLTLTPEGRDLHERALRLLHEAEQIEQAALAARGEPSGIIKVTAPPPIATSLICPALPQFREHHPKLVIDLRLNDRRVDLIEEGFDLAIRVGELDDSRLLCKALAPNMFCAFGAPEYLERKGTPEHLDDLANHDCVNFRFQGSGQPATWPFRIGARTVETVPVASIIVDEGNSVMVVAACGGGICVAPTYVAEPYVKTGQLVPVLTRFAVQRRNVSALWPQSRRASPNVRAFLSFLSDVFAASAARTATLLDR